jgi:acetyl-CoA carboxylase biotin carboxyl carrier protein
MNDDADRVMAPEAEAPMPGPLTGATDAPSAPAGAADGADTEASVATPADGSLLDLIDRLAALLERTELTELEVQVGATGLVLRKPSALQPVAPVVAAGAASGAPAGGAGTEAGAAMPATAAGEAGPPPRPAVMAPLTGIWYGAPAPGSAPYVNLGGEVAVGQVIGLIEAMKLFNEIKSDKAGRVAKINAEDGKLVRAKQPLIEVDPL